MIITVFGGSSPLPGEPAYQEALELGFLLGKAGHTVMSGGYIGTMEAVSRGASKAGSHVVGVTCDEIEAWRNRKANSWVKEEWHYPTLRERMYALIDRCDAAIALPGGIGTLAEISVMWNQLVIHPDAIHPIICVGQAWERLFHILISEQPGYLHKGDDKLVTFVSTVQQAAQEIASLNNSSTNLT